MAPATILACEECGQPGQLRTAKVGEDQVACWVECQCGRKGIKVEDAIADTSTAIDLWNRGAYQ